jgi:hypothetical protein
MEAEGLESVVLGFPFAGESPGHFLESKEVGIKEDRDLIKGQVLISFTRRYIFHG